MVLRACTLFVAVLLLTVFQGCSLSRSGPERGSSHDLRPEPVAPTAWRLGLAKTLEVRSPFTWRQVLVGLKSEDPDMRDWFLTLLTVITVIDGEKRDRAIEFETPPVKRSSLEHRFQFMVHEAPSDSLWSHKHKTGDANAFGARRLEDHTGNRHKGAVIFYRSGDTYLTSPPPGVSHKFDSLTICPTLPEHAFKHDRHLFPYPHLAPFIKHAGHENQHRLLRAVATQMSEMIFSGQTVSLDSRPTKKAWVHFDLEVHNQDDQGDQHERNARRLRPFGLLEQDLHDWRAKVQFRALGEVDDEVKDEVAEAPTVTKSVSDEALDGKEWAPLLWARRGKKGGRKEKGD